jgi:cytidylate kinase
MSRLTEEDPELDRMIDERAIEESKKEGVVIDATLSGWMAHEPDIRIFLKTPFEARIRRIAEREGIPYEKAEKETRVREGSERERFQEYYGLDVTDFSIYDVILNTELYEPEGTARILKKVVEEYCSNR